MNVSPDTTVFLWGLVGKSPWGSFRSILEQSQDRDGATRRIHLRGIQDETDASMTTISRLVTIDRAENSREYYKRHARFSDFGHVHVPVDRQVAELVDTINNIHEKSPLDSMVLNDVDFGCLHVQIVDAINIFCENRSIPLFMRIRNDAAKYRFSTSRAIVCTLSEWCKLVGSKEDASFWSQNIGQAEVGADFIHNCLASFRSADAIAVLVGDDWIDSILLVEHDKNENNFRLMQLPGLPAADKSKSQQVGVSDVFLGAVAAALPREKPSNGSLVGAICHAMNVVATYQISRWHHIHPLRQNTDTYRRDIRSLASVAGAARYLPVSADISLQDAKTDIPDVVSVSDVTKRALSKMVSDVRDDLKSIVLAATGGSGKSLIASRLSAVAREGGWKTFSVEEIDIKWDLSKPNEVIEKICATCRQEDDEKIFIIVDEVLKLKGGSTVASNGVVLLNRAAEKRVRFFFIDADFLKINFDNLRSQFARRVEWHSLPSAWQRPEDIPYVAASFLCSQLGASASRATIEVDFLLEVMEWIMKERLTFGDLLELLKKILRKRKASADFSLQWIDLPMTIRGKSRPQISIPTSLFRIVA
ncbi:hypothetical protein LRH25_29765 [Ideonella azotifigens]|uniref:hypothetical protein n=1 Tax=Ideonella azotifigens TaxID=513160 RepID=UPI0014768325|nr:hypothetical protein [Ideonella azotifigens]MCD2344518.1 hypothetical protein [Ideonella azotifigens]